FGDASRNSSTRIAIVRNADRGAIGEKIRGALDWTEIISLTDLKSPAFVGLLQTHAGQYVVAAKMVHRDRDDETAIGERRIVFRETHAVRAERARLRHARHDKAAAAHAEREQIVASVG